MISFFAKHPTAANLLMLILLAIGIMSLGSLRRETFPNFAAEELEIRVIYPGASAEEVEESICQRIEDALDSVNMYLKRAPMPARESESSLLRWKKVATSRHSRTMSIQRLLRLMIFQRRQRMPLSSS